MRVADWQEECIVQLIYFWPVSAAPGIFGSFQTPAAQVNTNGADAMGPGEEGL